MYCTNCGNQIDDNAVICTKCGCLTEAGKKMNLPRELSQQNSNQGQASSSNKTLGTIAKVFMIISTVFMGLYIIPLIWCLPMTLSLSRKLKNNEPISIGFKICILLFVNTIAGILLLCMKDE